MIVMYVSELHNFLYSVFQKSVVCKSMCTKRKHVMLGKIGITRYSQFSTGVTEN